MSEMFLSVVLPSYDEMANLQKGVLDKVLHYLNRKKITYEVIVVDDGSTDGSVDFVKEFTKENKHVKLIENKHTGKAGAVTTGVLEAKGKYILFADMDQATPIEEIDSLLPWFDRGYDIVIGSRSTKRKGAPMIRLFVSRASIILRKIIVGLTDLTDTQCGFKMFTHDAAQELFGKVKKLHNGFKTVSGSTVTSGFDVELLYLAEKLGYAIKEVSVRWLYVETRHVSPVKDSLEGVLDLLRIRLNQYKGKYQ